MCHSRFKSPKIPYKPKQIQMIPIQNIQKESMQSLEHLEYYQQGGFGSIYKSKINEKVVIVKKMNSTDYYCLEGFQREVFALKQLQNAPHVVELYDIFWESRYLHLVLKCYEMGDLNMYLNANGALELMQVQIFTKQLLIGLSACHSMNIAHNDIKSENIFLTQNNGEIELVLGDFGCATVCKSKYTTGSLGSPTYLAPEQLMGKKYSPLKSDMWALGVVIYEMIYNCNPFYDESNDFEAIRRNTLEFKLPGNLPLPIKSFMNGMLCRVPQKRLNCKKAMQHTFISGKRSTFISRFFK
eukprot:NODE_558_length_6080_cov_0.296773.p2 type:complete len:298 gc:universal NODE_558_length_6080_cov_0.296773:3166-2273(-)